MALLQSFVYAQKHPKSAQPVEFEHKKKHHYHFNTQKIPHETTIARISHTFFEIYQKFDRLLDLGEWRGPPAWRVLAEPF
jgi:hypothetical protein